jgi:hypothetical protein
MYDGLRPGCVVTGRLRGSPAPCKDLMGANRQRRGRVSRAPPSTEIGLRLDWSRSRAGCDHHGRGREVVAGDEPSIATAAAGGGGDVDQRRFFVESPRVALDSRRRLRGRLGDDCRPRFGGVL